MLDELMGADRGRFGRVEPRGRHATEPAGIPGAGPFSSLCLTIQTRPSRSAIVTRPPYLAWLSVAWSCCAGEVAGVRGWAGLRASRASPAAATSSQAATATQSTARLQGSMKPIPAALPNDKVATLYIPIGKTTVHSAGS